MALIEAKFYDCGLQVKVARDKLSNTSKESTLLSCNTCTMVRVKILCLQYIYYTLYTE